MNNATSPGRWMWLALGPAFRGSTGFLWDVDGSGGWCQAWEAIPTESFALAAGFHCWHDDGVISLTEIEQAVDALPPQQQRLLLQWLQRREDLRHPPAVTFAASRDAWLKRLENRRERGRTGCGGTPLQQVLDDIRGE